MFRSVYFIGRLYQVEYAMEAIGHAGQALGVLGKDGIILASQKKTASKLLDSGGASDKTFKIDDHICCSVAGITADANILINYARLEAQRYLLRYHEPIPVEVLLQRVCDLKQGYTQYGGNFSHLFSRLVMAALGLRPFGTSFLFAGWDRHYGFQLYQSDPSGNYGGWRATAIGANNQAAQSILKSDWKEDMNMDDTMSLVIKVLSKTLDSTTLDSEKRMSVVVVVAVVVICLHMVVFM